MKFLSFCLFFVWAIQVSVFGQSIKAGPMLGHTHMMEANIWVQTTSACEVQVAYWDLAKTSNNYASALKSGMIMRSAIVAAHAKGDHIAKFRLGRLEPGTTYGYRILINGKLAGDAAYAFKTQQLFQWRTDPPEFSFALGSCAYISDTAYDRPGKPYGSGYEIFQRIHEKKPDVMLWLGDNYYLREADWWSETGIRHRASHTRSVAQLQPLLANTVHYAIWDDHDFGPNDSDRSYVLKETALQVFKDYWINPTYGVNGNGGITTMFQYGDVDVFMLDNRYFRTANKCKKCPERIYLGKEQIDWLVEAMVGSFAPFKIVAVGGQILNTHQDHETYINLNEPERAYLLKRIEEENIKGVVFVTGDRHFSELSQVTNASGNRVLDMTSSPLTSGVYRNPKDVNANRVEGTLYDQDHNFTILSFSGKRKERIMTITLYGAEGQKVWERQFKEGE